MATGLFVFFLTFVTVAVTLNRHLNGTSEKKNPYEKAILKVI